MGDDDGYDEDEYPAVLEFLSTFSTISTPPETLDDLRDGVALYEALGEIAPDFFDPTTVARHLGENWALKSSNLRKLVRNLERYWRSQGKSASQQLDSDALMAIAKGGSAEGAVLNLVELVAAAAVTCPNKSEFVGRLVQLSPETQAVMKGVLQRSLARLSDLDDDDDDDDDEANDDDEDNDDENELVFGGTSSSLGAGGGGGGGGRSGAGDPGGLFPEEQMSSLKQEIALLKSQHAMEKDDMAKTSDRLQSMVDDLQERLYKRQEELIAVEEDLSSTQASLETAKAQLATAVQDKSQLADDLEIAMAKASQLAKAEATLSAYKRKLESQGMMNQATRDLEDQAAQYIKQIVELEAQVKKASNLGKTVTDLQDSVSKLEREKADLLATNGSLAAQVSDLQGKLKEADRARKMLADEVTELRAQAEVEASFAAQQQPKAGGAAEPSSPRHDPELAQRVQQLEAENKQLREMSVQAAVARDDSESGKAANAALQAEIERLRDEVAHKARECAKISDDKNKLESYTKRTLAKFQDKYLVALQECKTKLKEKQDKIEALESRSASERTAQKREERLLSSTIYELGLAIMQNRLKER